MAFESNGLENELETIKDQISKEYVIINSDLTCIICNQISINACNGLCGCKYCWDCIETYLNGEEKCCPGDLEICKKQLLHIDGNILVDQSTQDKISRIVVKCIDSGKKSPEEFRKIGDDVVEYETGAVKCPYSSLGCCESTLIRDEMNEHLNALNYSHTKWLMQWIDNLRNELKTIKSDIANSRKENRGLRKEIENIKVDVDKKQAVIAELIISDEMKSQQIEHLMHQLQNTPIQSTETTRLVENEPSETPYLNNNIDEEASDDTVATTESAKIYETMEIICEKINSFNRKIRQLETVQEKQNYGEFVWTIDKLSDKIITSRKAVNKEIYSDSFYSHRNGYKMCMRVDPSGINVGKGSHLAIYFCILEGPYDDILQWPMRHSVTFSLIDQQSGLVHKSRTARFEDVPDNFAWNKPTGEKKIGFGYHKFISMDELLNNECLCRNDRIFIICSVDTSM